MEYRKALVWISKFLILFIRLFSSLNAQDDHVFKSNLLKTEFGYNVTLTCEPTVTPLGNTVVFLVNGIWHSSIRFTNNTCYIGSTKCGNQCRCTTKMYKNSFPIKTTRQSNNFTCHMRFLINNVDKGHELMSITRIYDGPDLIDIKRDSKRVGTPPDEEIKNKNADTNTNASEIGEPSYTLEYVIVAVIGCFFILVVIVAVLFVTDKAKCKSEPFCCGDMEQAQNNQESEQHPDTAVIVHNELNNAKNEKYDTQKAMKDISTTTSIQTQQIFLDPELLDTPYCRIEVGVNDQALFLTLPRHETGTDVVSCESDPLISEGNASQKVQHES